MLSRRYDLPVYANPATHQAAEARVKKLHQGCEFETGTGFALDDLHIHPFRISHDTADPVGFLVSDGTHSVAYCTDTGKITTLIRQRLFQCQALILESNYDPDMLLNGPYPMYIKQRVRSNQGHLANNEATAFLAELCTTEVQEVQHVVLAHLSETNNHPDLVTAQVRQEIGHLDPAFSWNWPARISLDGLLQWGKPTKSGERWEVQSRIVLRNRGEAGKGTACRAPYYNND
ncbi:Beta-lactamase superfamily domain-containing protein [Candidatus Electrothrix aarhusensis]|uniref:Beta-lactamase superfamily domain-containing protein n=1 Tax=Candidatus Electrothrix aarhusensis TaxID=1859131 RepID=A0A3S3U5B6_9BACT|nr:Beta-lactamase superfamily domain-containing protein [Candidatus Electrothrix aarhusensis]